MDNLRDLGVESLAIPHNSNGSDGQMFKLVDWAGNLLWTEIKNLSKENLIVLKKFVSNSDGYITLIKSGEGLNFYDQAFTTNKIHYNISQKIKESFDPKRILNPNKMYSGI